MFYADLSMAVNNRNCVIKCNGFDEMMIFKENVLEQFPEYYGTFPFERVWEDTVSKFDYRYHNSVCFGFEVAFDGTPRTGFCDEEWYVEQGFEIIELSSILECSEISEANTDINLLFG